MIIPDSVKPILLGFHILLLCVLAARAGWVFVEILNVLGSSPRQQKRIVPGSVESEDARANGLVPGTPEDSVDGSSSFQNIAFLLQGSFLLAALCQKLWHSPHYRNALRQRQVRVVVRGLSAEFVGALRVIVRGLRDFVCCPFRRWRVIATTRPSGSLAFPFSDTTTADKTPFLTPEEETQIKNSRERYYEEALRFTLSGQQSAPEAAGPAGDQRFRGRTADLDGTTTPTIFVSADALEDQFELLAAAADPDERFQCPILHNFLRDPVLLVLQNSSELPLSSKQNVVYSRQSLLDWILRRNVAPVTRYVLKGVWVDGEDDLWTALAAPAPRTAVRCGVPKAVQRAVARAREGLGEAEAEARGLGAERNFLVISVHPQNLDRLQRYRADVDWGVWLARWSSLCWASTAVGGKFPVTDVAGAWRCILSGGRGYVVMQSYRSSDWSGAGPRPRSGRSRSGGASRVVSRGAAGNNEVDGEQARVGGAAGKDEVDAEQDQPRTGGAAGKDENPEQVRAGVARDHRMYDEHKDDLVSERRHPRRQTSYVPVCRRGWRPPPENACIRGWMSPSWHSIRGWMSPGAWWHAFRGWMSPSCDRACERHVVGGYPHKCACCGTDKFLRSGLREEEEVQRNGHWKGCRVVNGMDIGKGAAVVPDQGCRVVNGMDIGKKCGRTEVQYWVCPQHAEEVYCDSCVLLGGEVVQEQR